MGLFDSPQKKWINNNSEKPWNLLFTDLTQYDVMLTKLMVYKSLCFADDVISSDLFKRENMALRTHTIALAKMHFYHLATKSPTVHNLFYGYLYEFYVNHYKESMETAYLALHNTYETERWFRTYYYDFYDNDEGDFSTVLDHYCKSVMKNKTTDGEIVAICTSEAEMKDRVLLFLMDMHFSFLSEAKI